jgi:hypothetical protein
MNHMLPIALILMATQAGALSCLPTDPIKSFQVATESASEYLILRGRFGFDATLLPQSEVSSGLVLPQPIPAQFQGQSLTVDGFTNPITGLITVMPVCIGAFCGGLTPGVDVIAFARKQDNTYVVDADPCSAWVFTPDAVTEAALAACVRGEPCVPRPS